MYKLQVCFHVSFTEVSSGPFGHKSTLVECCTDVDLLEPSTSCAQDQPRGTIGDPLQTHFGSSAWHLPFVIQSSVRLDIQCMTFDLTSKTLFR